ncbi:MAG: radical SAM family heme chaperone HemW [Deltaproteobacteria bacterium]
MFTRLYFHIPFCRSKCPYCAFNSRETNSELDSYVDLLLQELRLAAEDFLPASPLESIYFGGGTPSLLHPEQIALLIELAGTAFDLTQSAEITLEANPGTVTPELLAGFRAAGVNRLSIGVQSFRDDMLATLGRIHTSAQALIVFTGARLAGFDNIGIDLIHALPGQTLEMWRHDLEQAILLAPEHISVYGLTIEDGTPFAERYQVESPLLADQDLAAAMFEMADSLLCANGYEHYEIANYARPGCRSQHNSGYWQRYGYLGLGAGAHSLLLDKGYGIRFFNAGDMDVYSDSIALGVLPHQEVTTLNRADAMSEFMFLGLRMSYGVDFKSFEQQFGESPAMLYSSEFSDLAKMGLIVLDSGRARLTCRGMMLSNQVFVHFLP